MLTQFQFLTRLNGYNNAYVHYALVGRHLSVDKVVGALNMCGLTNAKNGRIVIGQNEHNLVSFTIEEGDVQVIDELTKKLNCIGYADSPWANTGLFWAVKNGDMFCDFSINWVDGEPTEEDGWWNCSIDLVDNVSGLVFHTGAPYLCEKGKNILVAHINRFRTDSNMLKVA